MPTRSTSILLVVHDDSQLVRQVSKMTSEVADVITARDSQRAIAIIDSNQPLNAVLVGRSGDGVRPIDILSHLHTRRPEVRSIMLGDPADLSTTIEALHSGVVDHVLNPLRERELLAILALPAPRAASAIPNVTVNVPSQRAL